MAQALATNGASRVYILGRRLHVLEAAAQGHSGLTAVQCDVTSKASLQAAVDRITAEAGHVNLLVANSGILGPTSVNWDQDMTVAQLRDKMFVNGDMDAWTNTLHVNVTGAFFTLLAFLGLLEAGNVAAEQGTGFGPRAPNGVNAVQSQVVFTSSIAAFSRASTSGTAYLASKAALMHLTKQTCSSLSRFGIRVNALAPGLFPSELAAGLIGDRKPENEGPDHPAFQPSRRFGSDEDMAGSILYLAGRSGGFCNGLILMMDGGRLGIMPAAY